MSLTYAISNEAEKDWAEIIKYTLDNFGEQQVHIYNNKMHQCLQDLSNEQGHFKELTIKRHRILTKHCQRHYIFGLSEINKPLLIIAILHERMDLMQRLKHRL